MPFPRPILLGLLVLGLVITPSATAATLAPKSARGFRDSVGVNTHIVYFDTAYGDWSRIVAKLDEIGIDHLRDGVYGNPAPNWRDWNERYYRAVELAAAHGKRFLFGMGGPGFDAGSVDDLARVVAGRLRLAADGLESPNEFDYFGGTADWPTPLRSYIRGVHDRVKSDPSLRGLPFVGPSFALGGSRRRLGSLGTSIDIGNMHPYTGAHAPTRQHVADELAQSAFVSGTKPVWATEAGFHNAMSATSGQAPAPDDVAAVYTLRTLLEHFDAGIARTYLYELIDEKPNPDGTDPEQHFGLLRNDFSLKPAAVAIKNLLAEIGRPAAFGTLTPLNVTLQGDTAGVRQLLLQDGSGHYRLVLWQSGSIWDPTRRTRIDLPARALRVALPTTAVTAYQPMQSSDGHPLTVADSAVRVTLGADPMVLDFTAKRTGLVVARAPVVLSCAYSAPAPPRPSSRLRRRAPPRRTASCRAPRSCSRSRVRGLSRRNASWRAAARSTAARTRRPSGGGRRSARRVVPGASRTRGGRNAAKCASPRPAARRRASARRRRF